MPTPLFSVITPAYNSAATIAHAIQSIQAQTLSDWEYLIADDGSTDDTVNIIKKFSNKDRRIKLFKLPHNQGPCIARNIIMQQATGEFLAFLDADDEAMPHRLEQQYHTFLHDPDLAALGSAIEIFGDATGIITPATEPTPLAIHLLFNCELFMPAMAVRRQTQIELDLWFDSDYNLTADWEIFSRLVRFRRIANLPQVLTRYRRSRTQMTAGLTDTVTDAAAKLRRNQLIWLGVPENEIDIEAHIAVSPCYWPLKKAIPDEAFEKKRVTKWINTLIAVNARIKRYPVEIFQKILIDILDNYHVQR
jgi:glycosyltransferase involved in cell wall biosynthesis